MKKIHYCIPVLLSILVITHFTIVISDVIPYNPITNKHEQSIDKYMNPLFSQNWHLFAPDPVAHNDGIQVKVEFKNKQDSGWVDITTPMIDQMHANYFSPLNRMARISTGIVSELTSEEELVLNYRKKLEETEEKKEQVKELDKQQEKEFEQNEMLLYRYGSAYAKYLYPEESIKSIEMRIIRQDNTPFSKRKNPIDKKWKVVMEFPKKELIKDIVPIL